MAKRLANGFAGAVVVGGQPHAGPTLSVEAGSFGEVGVGDTLPTQADVTSAKVAGHRGPVQTPTGGQEFHAVTGLVLGEQLAGLARSQAALSEPRRGRGSSHRLFGDRQ